MFLFFLFSVYLTGCSIIINNEMNVITVEVLINILTSNHVYVANSQYLTSIT